MSEIKNNFLQGKMNQDLDERLIPNGQYREALNIEVSTSEEAGAGTVQNILGNTLTSNDIMIYDHCNCIGSIADEKNNKLYWFIHCSDRDAIIEYDEILNKSQTILCDVFSAAGTTDGSNPSLQPFLKFSNQKITGINIIDDFLFWTDGNNEPKKVNIKKAKEKQKTLGSGNGQTINHQSRYWGLDSSPFIREEHLTVIKKKPLLAPKVIINNSHEGQGSPPKTDSNRIFNRIFPRFCTRYKYADGEYSAFSPFTEVIFNPLHKAGSNNNTYFSTEESYNISMTNTIDSIDLYGIVPADVPDDVVQIDILAKVENSPIIYSVKNIKRSDPQWGHGKDLFTESLGSAAPLNSLFGASGRCRINSENVHAALPENQLLRSWDNVPKKALAQEVTGNRIVYGNYTQGYSLKDESNNDINTNILANYKQRFSSSGEISGGLKSLKSQREYRLGVSYADKYGRETPIFTSDLADVNIPWRDGAELLGEKSTMLTAYLGNNFPQWAHSHKFYVKQTSGEYYNLVMLKAHVPGSYDLWDNIDQHLWISFASSDRNKISEDTYLIVKKSLNPAELAQVSMENKYKILDIQNEAPDAIKFNYHFLGRVPNADGSLCGTDTDGSPLVEAEPLFTNPLFRIDHTNISGTAGAKQIHVDKSKWIDLSGAPLIVQDSDDTTVDTPDNIYISWRGQSGGNIENSSRYKVISVSTSSNETYVLKLASNISVQDANIAADAATDDSMNKTLTFSVERKREDDGEDFSGKFFVKIKQDFEGAVSSLVGVKGEDGGVEQEIYIAAAQQVNYLANGFATQFSTGSGSGDYTTGMVGLTSQWSFAGDDPENITGATATDDNISHTAEHWDALEGINSNGFFFIDRMAFAAASFGTLGFASYSGQPFGVPQGHSLTGQAMVASPTSTTLHREFEWDPTQDAGPRVNGENLEDIASIEAGAPNRHRYLLELPDSFGVDATSNSELMEFVNDYQDANNISDDEQQLIYAPFAKKAYGWPGVYNSAEATSQWWRGYDLQNQESWEDGNPQQVTGLEGIVTAGTEHTQGRYRWRTNPYNLELDNVYEENGKFYLHISFLGPGVDLHDGNGLENNLQDTAELNGKDGIAKYMQGIWGGGVFTNDIRGEYGEQVSLQDFDAYFPPEWARDVDEYGIEEGYDMNYYGGYHQAMYNRFPTEFGTPTNPQYQFAFTLESDLRRRKYHVEFEGNYGIDNEPLLVGPAPGVDTCVGYDSNYTEAHENQWNPSYGHPQAAQVNAFLMWMNSSNAQFRFSGDSSEEVFTILSVKEKRLYNHTPWRRRFKQDNSGGNILYKPAGDSVEEAAVEWANTCGTGVIPSGAGTSSYDSGVSKAKHLANKIIDFGKTSNRRVVYILELDKDPLARSIGDSSYDLDANSFTDIEFISTSGAQVLNTQLATFPAIMETEPKQGVDLDLYYEASDSIPTKLNTKESAESFAPIGCRVEFPNLPGSGGGQTIRLRRWLDNGVFEVRAKDELESGFNWFNALGATINYASQEVRFIRDDESYTTGIISVDYENMYFDEFGELTVSGEYWSGISNDDYPNGIRAAFKIESNVPGEVGLNWYNCFTFQDGVESNRVRDDFNEMQITNGAKVSTVLEQQYDEEHRKNGLIYSGIYNSSSGVNNLNQFIAAEKITKDINPTYGSIQKLHSRTTDLVALCEDRVIKILANKDALFNADGTPQLVASENVLGQAIPFVGDYGISKNPESFASESYRAYFTDKQRGAVLRLSMDGLTPISDAGMHDWFRDRFHEGDFSWIGSYDNYKKQYNLTISEKYFGNLISNSTFYYGSELQSFLLGENIVDNPTMGGGTALSFNSFQDYIYNSNTYDTSPANPYFEVSYELRYHDEIPAGSIYEGGIIETVVPASAGPLDPTYTTIDTITGSAAGGLAHLMFTANFEDRETEEENVFSEWQGFYTDHWKMTRTIHGTTLYTENDWAAFHMSNMSTAGWYNNKTTGTVHYYGEDMDPQSRVANIWIDLGGEISGLTSGYSGFGGGEGPASDGILFSNIYFGPGEQNPEGFDNYVTIASSWKEGLPTNAVSDDILNWGPDMNYTASNGLLNNTNNVDNLGNFPLQDFSNTGNFSIFEGEEILIEFSAKRYGNNEIYETEGGYWMYDNAYRFWIQLVSDGEVISSSYLSSGSVPEGGSMVNAPYYEYKYQLPDDTQDSTVGFTDIMTTVGAPSYDGDVVGPWNKEWCEDATVVFDRFNPGGFNDVKHKAYFKFVHPDGPESTFEGDTRLLFNNLEIRIGITANSYSEDDWEQGAALMNCKVIKLTRIETPGVVEFAGSYSAEDDPSDPPIPYDSVPEWTELIFNNTTYGGNPLPTNWYMTYNADSDISNYYYENPGTLNSYTYTNAEGSSVFGHYLTPNETYLPFTPMGSIVNTATASVNYGVDNLFSGEYLSDTLEVAHHINFNYNNDGSPPQLVYPEVFTGTYHWYMVDIYCKQDGDFGVENNLFIDSVFTSSGLPIGSGNTEATAGSLDYKKAHFGNIIETFGGSSHAPSFKKTTNYLYGYASEDVIPSTFVNSTTDDASVIGYDTDNYGNFAGAECYRSIFRNQSSLNDALTLVAEGAIDADIVGVRVFSINANTGSLNNLQTPPSSWTPVKNDQEIQAVDLKPTHLAAGFVDNNLVYQQHLATPEVHYSDGKLCWITSNNVTGWKDTTTVLPNTPSVGGYRFDFTVHEIGSTGPYKIKGVKDDGMPLYVEGEYDYSPTIDMINGSLNCFVMSGASNKTGFKLTNITQPGSYSFLINFDQDDPNAGFNIETIETPNGDESYPEVWVDQQSYAYETDYPGNGVVLGNGILFESGPDGFVGAIDEVRITDMSESYTSGEIGGWSVDYGDSDIDAGYIYWDGENQTATFDSITSDNVTQNYGSEFYTPSAFSLYQTIDTTNMQEGDIYNLSFNYNFEEGTGVSFYFTLDGSNSSTLMYGQSVTGEGFYSNTFTIGGSQGIIGEIPQDVILNSIVFQPFSTQPTLNVNGSIDNVALQQSQLPEDKTTISFSEDVGGWVSLKSFIPESGLSLSNHYYTMKRGELYKHYTNEARNTFYGDYYPSTIKLVLNTGPSTVKSFNTISFEGTTAEILQYIDHRDINFYNQTGKNGWSVSSIKTDLQEGYIPEFIKKEGKWFNYIKGTPLQISDGMDTTDSVFLSNANDISDLNFQGIGVAAAVNISVSASSSPSPSNGSSSELY